MHLHGAIKGQSSLSRSQPKLTQNCTESRFRRRLARARSWASLPTTFATHQHNAFRGGGGAPLHSWSSLHLASRCICISPQPHPRATRPTPPSICNSTVGLGLGRAVPPPAQDQGVKLQGRNTASWPWILPRPCVAVLQAGRLLSTGGQAAAVAADAGSTHKHSSEVVCRGAACVPSPHWPRAMEALATACQHPGGTPGAWGTRM